jgi:hypothetical protein
MQFVLNLFIVPVISGEILLDCLRVPSHLTTDACSIYSHCFSHSKGSFDYFIARSGLWPRNALIRK